MSTPGTSTSGTGPFAAPVGTEPSAVPDAETGPVVETGAIVTGAAETGAAETGTRDPGASTAGPGHSQLSLEEAGDGTGANAAGTNGVGTGRSGPHARSGRRRRVMVGEGHMVADVVDRALVVRAVQHLPLLAIMVAYAYHFGQITVDTLRSYQQDAYDMAIPDQGIWLLSRFHAPFVTVMGKDLFGDHTSFIFVLLVPLFWVYPHTAALLVVQAISLALGAVPIYLLGRHLLHSNALATVLAGAYLLNPALQQGNLEQFHVEAFEAPLLGFAVYAVVTWRPRLLLVVVVLLLACKQDDFLYVVPLGIWVAKRGHFRAGAAIAGAGAAVAAIENLLLVPLLLNGIPTTYAGWVPFGGVRGFLDTLVKHPGQFWDYFVSQGRPWYLWQMGFGTGLAGLLAPGVLLVALPEVAFNTLSDFGYQHQIVRHYSMPLVALLVCGAVYAVSRLRRPGRRAFASLGVALCALWSCTLWGDLPFSDSVIPNLNPDNPVVAGINKLVARIPPSAAVSVAQNFVPNLDHRRQIYMFPNPFAQSYYGNPVFDGQPLPSASQVQYILLPTCLSCSPDTAGSAITLRGIERRFRVVGHTTGAVLYERKSLIGRSS